MYDIREKFPNLGFKYNLQIFCLKLWILKKILYWNLFFVKSVHIVLKYVWISDRLQITQYTRRAF